MAMRKDEIPDNKFTLPLDARDGTVHQTDHQKRKDL